MARCAHCETETELYHGTSPICIQCDDLQSTRRAIREKLFHDLDEATRRAEASTGAFASITRNISRGIPHPDGMQPIRNAARVMEAASKEMMKAHNRLADFIERGIVPDDLKRGA